VIRLPEQITELTGGMTQFLGLDLITRLSDFKIDYQASAVIKEHCFDNIFSTIF
jgi:hypothetical protein